MRVNKWNRVIYSLCRYAQLIVCLSRWYAKCWFLHLHIFLQKSIKVAIGSNICPTTNCREILISRVISPIATICVCKWHHWKSVMFEKSICFTYGVRQIIFSLMLICERKTCKRKYSQRYVFAMLYSFIYRILLINRTIIYRNEMQINCCNSIS